MENVKTNHSQIEKRIIMDQSLIELFEVTTCALNKTIYQKAIADDQSFYYKTLYNGLSGLVLSALNQEKISKNLFEHLQKDVMIYVLSDSLQMETIDQINNLLNEHGIDHIYLKGSRLKKIYPETYMRAMGDIDILIRKDDLPKVHEIFQEQGIKCTDRSTQHDGFELKNKVRIEIHPTIYRNFNPAYESLFVEAWDYAVHVNKHLYEFPYEYELVYLLYHLAKHIHSSGVGIRSVLDIGLYLKVYEKNIDNDVLKSYLDLSSLYQFFQSIVYLNYRYFDIKSLEPWITGYKLDESFFETLTEYLSVSGVHGKGVHFNEFAPRLASNKLKSHNKFRFVIGLIFPNLESVKNMYPFVKKHPILLPFGWIKRWMRLIFVKPKTTFKRIKKLRVKEEEIDKVTDLFQKLGLK